MINLAVFLLKNSTRHWLTNKKGSKVTLIAPLLILALFTLLQLNVLSKPEEAMAQLVGWVVIVILFIFILFGLLSNRLPSRMEDVMWVYMLPMSMSRIVLTCLCWQLLLRSSFWLGAALIADTIRFMMGHTYEHLFFQAFMSLAVISLLEAGLFAASSSRGKWKVSIPVGIVGAIGLMVTALSFFFSQMEEPLFPSIAGAMELLAFYVGAFMVGEFHFAGLLFVVVFIVLAILVIQAATKGLELKEKLTREADFWSSFSSFSSLAASAKGGDQASYWGGKAWTGVFAFVWFEWVLWRKHRTALVFQFIAGAGLTIVMVIKWPSWLMIYFGIILASALIGGFFSGLIRHAQSGDLLLLPGSRLKKVILLEIVDLIPPFATVGLYYIISITIGANLALEPIAAAGWLLVLFVAIACFRISLFVDVFLKNLDISMGAYYKRLIMYCIVIIGIIFILLFFHSTLIELSLEMLVMVIMALVILYGAIRIYAYK
ncbi:sporulation killing factor system integral membrane protein [Paenibacillus sp. FSL H8-0537]|uniref:sporulation killing factor system integral membrane protein n=1 Tax=Paenibacillus sp. FSL H8-0537 TaxID=2921399 RepID=UPI003100CE93